jgi:hypothetical protein
MNIRILFLLIFCFVSSIAPGAIAEERAAPILFGPEFTFSSLKMLYSENFEKDRGKSSALLARYANWLEKECVRRGCIVQETRSTAAGNPVSAVQFLLESGTIVKASTDMNVIEFSVSPMDLEMWEKQSGDIQSLIFDGMSELGLSPQRFYGSGHLNIDLLTAFGGDVRAVRDFFVDFYNHPALADGVLEKDPFNARSFSLLGEKQRSAFFTLVNDVDSGKLATIAEFRRRLEIEVYSEGKFLKGFALLLKQNRLEIRSLRAQSDAVEFVELARLFSARIAYLKGLRAAGSPIKPMEKVGANFGWQSFSQFYHYVRDAGASWERARAKLLPDEYKIYPTAMQRADAYGDRIECIYWMKHQRTKIYESVALKMPGLGK